LAKKRWRWRGFNQSEVIAKQLGIIWQLSVICCLARARETKNQAELTGAARQENIKGAFVCLDRSSIKNKLVFLVDDVVTTGATMNECARVLIKNGSRQVIGVAVARTENS
jgi:ComF family protein